MKNTSSYRVKHLIINDIWRTPINILAYFIGNILTFFVTFTTIDLGYPLMGAIAIGVSFSMIAVLEDKAKATDFFMLPANIKEKFIAKIISFGVIYPIIIFLAATTGIYLGSEITGNPINWIEAIVGVCVMSLSQAMFFWGATFFCKNTIYKTLLVLVVTVLFFVAVFMFVNTALTTIYPYYEALHEYQNTHDEYLSRLFVYCGFFLSVLATIIFWTGSYFGLKEKEI